MNTLTMVGALPLTPPATAQNTDPAIATLLAIALQVPDGGLDHRVDLAAVALRSIGGRYTPVGDFRCVLHAGMPTALIAECCRLPVEQVTDRTPVAVALAALERYLTAPPYLLVTHQASIVSAVIARHSGACPALNTARLIDTAVLARSALEAPCPPDLRNLAAHLGVSAMPRRSSTATDAVLTGALYARLCHIDYDHAQPEEDATSARSSSHAHTGCPQVCGMARPGQEACHGHDA